MDEDIYNGGEYMSTRVTDSDGNLLWSPNDFGSYSTEKIELISKILSDLLSNLTLNMNTRVDEDSLSNIYTISQTHEKFLEKENASETISMAVISVLQTMYEEGRLVNPSTVDGLRTFISNLYNVCYGIDLSGNPTPSAASSYNRQIDSLRGSIDSNYSNILKIFSVIFETNIDGSYTNVSKVAKASDVGDISNLDTSILDKDNIVEAINYIASNSSNVGGNVSNLRNQVNRIQDDINTVKSDLDKCEDNIVALSSRVGVNESKIGTIDSTIINLSNRVNSNDSRLGVNEGNISNMRTELTTAESDIKTIQTNLGDKTSLTTSEKSSIVSAINSVVRSLMSIETGMSSIEARMSSIEARLNSLESGIS